MSPGPFAGRWELPHHRRLGHADSWLALDKPAGLPLHGGSDAPTGDLVSAASLPTSSTSPPERLRALQSLDAQASGLSLLARTAEYQRSFKGAVERREVEFVYQAIVTGRGSARPPELPARPGFELRTLDVTPGRALLEVRTTESSSAAVRVRLARLGRPVLGDVDNRGEPAWRLMLHLVGARGPLGVWPEAPAPWASWDWCAEPTAAALDPRDEARVAGRIHDALWRRRRLDAPVSALRLVNDAGDGLPGIVVDRYAKFAVLSVSGPCAEAVQGIVARELIEHGLLGVYLKRRPRADLRRQHLAELADSAPLLGQAAPERVSAEELGLHYWVKLGEGLSTGLFVDQRGNRERLSQRVRPGQRLLNLFSYTCAFSVVAAAVGASTVSVDVAARALSWGRDNFALNGLDATKHDFHRSDVGRWLGEAARSGQLFDWVVLDPPSFSTGKRGATFRISRDYGPLAAAALGLLAKGGTLIAVTNHRKTSLLRLRAVLRDAAASASRAVVSMRDGITPPDCPAGSMEPFPSKSVWVTVR